MEKRQQREVRGNGRMGGRMRKGLVAVTFFCPLKLSGIIFPRRKYHPLDYIKRLEKRFYNRDKI